MVLFSTILPINDVPCRYAVNRQGDRFFFEHLDATPHTSDCPSFYLWEEKGLWQTAGTDSDQPIADNLAQHAIEKIEHYYRPYRK